MFVAFGNAFNNKTLTKKYSDLTNNEYINFFPYSLRNILNENVKIALTEAGRFPYWTRANTYDLVGLNNGFIAVNKLDTAYLEHLKPDIIFIHTADTLFPFNGPENTLQVSLETIEELRKNKNPWREVHNPVERAPLVVYEYLKEDQASYNLIFVKLVERYQHLYAVRKDGQVNWDKFQSLLSLSFSEKYRKSYLEMKKGTG